MHVVIPAGYAATFALIVTPLLAYRAFRDARHMSRTRKVWVFASLAAGLACYRLVASALRHRF